MGTTTRTIVAMRILMMRTTMRMRRITMNLRAMWIMKRS
jgi:hypothetical protein